MDKRLKKETQWSVKNGILDFGKPKEPPIKKEIANNK